MKQRKLKPILTPEQEAMDNLLDTLEQPGTNPIAIFMGAGASKTFGYPLTRELMLKILRGLDEGKVLNEKPPKAANGAPTPGRELFEFLSRLLPGDRMTEETVPMVTGVLSLVDFALSTGQVLLPGSTIEYTRRMRGLLDRALLEVIPDHEMWRGSKKRQEPYYLEALAWLRGLMSRRPPGGVAIITTNYDMMSDLPVMEASGVKRDTRGWNIASTAQKVDFGFRWVHPQVLKEERVFSRPERPKMALFKLHGSTNWLRCPLCENIYINPRGPISLIAGDDSGEWDNECHCSNTQLEAQIVSPSFVRGMQEPNLIATWKNALDFLREADHWVMVGYSFPDEDVAIRALMTRSYGAGKIRYPQVSVVQWDDKARVNYESFFPPGSVRYVTGGFGLLLDRAKTRRSI
jgi:hypothetical protein